MGLIIFIVILCMSFTNINSFQETCRQNTDCPNSENTICIDGLCDCDSLSYFNNKTCLTYATEFQSYCEENEQCAFLGNNSICEKSSCVCENNYRWIQGQCLSYVDKGGNCTEDTDCYDGYDLLALSCVNGTCSCRDGFYDRGLDCRNISDKGKECMINIDCQNEELTCKRGKCVALPELVYEVENENEDSMVNFKENRRFLFYGSFTCDFDDDCRKMPNSECISKTCQCKSKHYFYNDACFPGISHCQEDSECTTNNSFCFLNTSCICKPGYFFDNIKGICIAELGVQSDQCNIQASIPIDGACYCRNYWYTNVNNRNCIKTTTQEMKSCVTNEFCNALGPYSFCNITGSTNGICMCSSFAELNEHSFYCEKQSEQPEDQCLRDKDCKLNEKCINEKCECITNFSKNKDGICLPDIGGSCEITSCSHIKNSKCISGKCGCTRNYIGQNTVCLKMADELGDECEVDAQCANLKHSICDNDGNGNNTCTCDVDYVEVSVESDSICMADKKYGSPCMNSTDCTLVLNQSFQCRNSICQCPVRKVFRNGYCVNGSYQINSSGKLISIFLLLFVVLFKMSFV